MASQTRPQSQVSAGCAPACEACYALPLRTAGCGPLAGLLCCWCMGSMRHVHVCAEMLFAGASSRNRLRRLHAGLPAKWPALPLNAFAGKTSSCPQGSSCVSIPSGSTTTGQLQ